MKSFVQVGHLPSIDMVRIRDGTVKAMNMMQNVNQDEEISARANGFRRMVEKFRDVVRFNITCYSNFTSD